MTRKGDYSIELIDAQTKEPFKEHPGKDKIDAYVEVEPGAEYYMKIHNYSEEEVVVECKVDGKRLGHITPISSNCCEEEGILHCDMLKSLKFSKIASNQTIQRTDTAQGTNESNRKTTTKVGIVEVIIYQIKSLEGYIFHHESTPFHNKNHYKFNAPNYTGKLVQSQLGTVIEHANVFGPCRRTEDYTAGKKLATIKVKYCTAVGLINEGILPEPPLWELHKMVFPQTELEKTAIAIEPSLVKFERRDSDGNVIISKQYEVFDLTSLSDESCEESVVNQCLESNTKKGKSSVKHKRKRTSVRNEDTLESDTESDESTGIIPIFFRKHRK